MIKTRCGGIGRRMALKRPYPYGCVGSSPTSETFFIGGVMINCAPYLTKLGLGCKKCEICFEQAYEHIEELKKQLSEKDDDISKLEREISRLEYNIQDLEDEKYDLEEELDSLKEKK